MVRLDLLQSQMDKLRKYQEDRILQVLIQLFQFDDQLLEHQ